ncbi:hypothetical protein [Pediococcus stilesii]|uniref:Uncharacterized protein n=1 Tax=Pediococcus stilesii TaxID=331679 RepID=A0A0R2KYG2_9LACO|nr:hypothetical protein [Pediococcus stilesii]KRN94595.1 hypothetical protein IV81_GL001232 [Pediococcus stilesii]
MNKFNLPLASNTLALALALHIGSGDDAHLIADKEHNGFLSIDQLKSINEGLGQRRWLPVNTDVLKLKPGHYGTGQLINGVPRDDANGFNYLDVDQIDDQHVRYEQTIGYNGISYVKIIHGYGDGNNVSAPNVWGRELRAYPLWQGGATKVGTVIKMADNAFKYKELRITYANGGGVYITTIKRRELMSITGLNPANDALGSIQLEIDLEFKDKNDGTKLTITQNFSHEDYGSVAQGTDVTEIWEIEGVM